MNESLTKNAYDDGDIPKVDLPQDAGRNCHRNGGSTEPLPESTRPRKDGPGGD